MKVKYSCTPCGVFRVEIEVPERAHDEDVVHWVSQTLGHAIGADHAKRSPSCTSRTMSEVMIPMPPGTDEIGKPVKN